MKLTETLFLYNSVKSETHSCQVMIPTLKCNVNRCTSPVFLFKISIKLWQRSLTMQTSGRDRSINQ